MTYVLYNPASNGGNGYEAVKCLNERFDGEVKFIDSKEIEDMKKFISELSNEDKVVVCGGDGTLNLFANQVDGLELSNDVFYYATGTGNDFMRDVSDKADNNLVKINEYIVNLPEVEVNGKRSKFINGVGFGVDGYCCEVGDDLHARGKKVNYTSIAVKGVLFSYKPCDAKVTVDGVEHTYKKVWIAPTMNGRYYGGGLNVTPAQDRLNEEKTVSVAVMYKANRIKTLLVFGGVSKGAHVKHTEMVDIISGKEISVEFTVPKALQIDGETVRNVTKYVVRSASCKKEEKIEQDDKLKV